MGYAHGTKWSDALVQQKIEHVMEKLDLTTMPTRSMIVNVTGNQSLVNEITRSGGVIGWAERLGIEHRGIETTMGTRFEKTCMEFIQSKYDFNVEMMKAGYPYDLLVNDNIKIDVKSSRMYQGKHNMYTFNLEKRFPTCDIFVAYCIDEENRIIRTYVVPSKVLSGITQLSIGISKSKYDIYLDKWDVLLKYDEFYGSF